MDRPGFGASGEGMGRVALALLVSWIVVSSSAVVIVIASPVPPLSIAAGREAVTAAAWTLIALFTAPRARATGEARPFPWGRMAASGILLGVHFACWVGSLSLTTVTHAAVFVSLQPLFAGLFGLFLGDRATWRLVIGVLIAAGGSLVLTAAAHGGDAGSPTITGDLVAVSAAACAALYLTVNRGIGDRVRLPVLLAWVNWIAALTIAAGVVASGGEWWHPEALWRREGLAILWLGLAPGLLGHGLMNWSARRVPVHVVSVAVLLEPVGAAALAYWFLAQKFGPREALGAVLLLSGALLTSLSTRARSAGAESKGAESKEGRAASPPRD